MLKLIATIFSFSAILLKKPLTSLKVILVNEIVVRLVNFKKTFVVGSFTEFKINVSNNSGLQILNIILLTSTLKSPSIIRVFNFVHKLIILNNFELVKTSFIVKVSTLSK